MSELSTRKRILLDTGEAQAYRAGQLSYDPVSKTALFDTGFSGVRVNVGQETHVRFYNDTGAQIDNGKPVVASGYNSANDCFTCKLADADDPTANADFIGVATMDVPNGEVGLATLHGVVRDVNTAGLVEGDELYVSNTPGVYTQTVPHYPSNRLRVGHVLKSDATTGSIWCEPNLYERSQIVKSYGFTSQGVGAGTYYRAGFYRFATTSVALNQGSLTQAYGTASKTYAAHCAIVPSGAGTVNTGQVGLRVTGILDSETGTQTAAQTQVITEDITTLSANTYYETAGKFSGECTWELYTVSGSPTTYSLTFNYGFAKYDDIGNKDFTITGFEACWLGAAADSTSDIQLLKHQATGWTYAASGFVPGNSAICGRLTDQALAPDLANGGFGAYKRVGLNTFINGADGEGFVIRVVTGSNNSFQSLNMHVQAIDETYE